ncbi:MAG: hypothetical protein ABIQ86_00120 [Steroidobacteraceae bacterium]
MRVGRNRDGGYLIESRDVLASDCLVSLGVSDDWSFEKAFVQIKDVPVFAHDGSIGAADFVKRILRQPWHPKVVARNALLLADYAWFFGRPGRNYLKTYVGSPTLTPNVTLAQVFEKLGSLGLSRPFLKIDIECSEYELLGDLLKFASATTGLAIEFHACESRMDEIVQFVESYPLQLVHVHVNNHGYAGEGLPSLLELTFSSSMANGSGTLFPHPLDRPNNKRAEEVVISFREALNYPRQERGSP